MGNSDIKREIKRFEKDYVRNEWEESVRLGVKREQLPKSRILDKEGVKRLLKEKKTLIEVAKPFMRELYDIVNNSGFSVTLTDENACLLDFVGDKDIIENSVNKVNFVIGSYWTPDCLGNTAIYTSIKYKKPIQLVGNEHYLYNYGDWTCSSSPIMVNGQLIGAISMKGYSKHTHLHTLGMVVAATKAIENQLVIIEKNVKLNNNMRYQQAVSEFIDSGFIAIDHQGIVTFLNNAGAEILNVNSEDIVGKHIESLFGETTDILEVLKTRKGYENREYKKYDRNRKITLHLIKTANPIIDCNGKIIGVIEKFSKIKTINNMIRNFVGNYGKFTFDEIITDDSAMKKAIKLAKIAANSESKVIVYGESGTGKELFVQSIHNASNRSDESFIAMNCSAIPNELIESELFGYESGSFTGASKDGHLGKFEMANGGTLFLDEIGDMPLHMQVKMLRCIQSNQITRIGSSNIIDLDVRIICATNKNLMDECKNGNFREDLYYRLNVLSIVIPPLRERKGDIRLLLNHFIEIMNRKLGKNIKTVSDNALRLLENYDWPGNVRELENMMERAVNICDREVIDVEDLSENITNQKYKSINTIAKELTCAVTGKALSPVEEAEYKMLHEALTAARGNISKTAGILRLSRNTVYSRINKYSIDVEAITN
ncbi:MAG: sigma 54-interacting transcriptional regulator [Sedimentibacter sp.]|uniref:sigma-54 interaction domain-containing protein n=1 Tax=Sedimentibacter sp. TaxID=1960295 RepID=UPI003159370C